MWSKRLDDEIEPWVEVGRPSAERLVWCARRYPRVSLLAYGDHQTWANGVLPQVAGMHNLHIALLPQVPLDQLSSDLPRSIDWGLMITDDVLYVSRAEQQHELTLQWLQGGLS